MAEPQTETTEVIGGAVVGPPSKLERLSNMLGKDKPPQVLALMLGRVIGKAVSAHPDQPVRVTIEAALPQGDITHLAFVLDAAEAADFQDTVVVQPKAGGLAGEQERIHPEPQRVVLAVFVLPNQNTSVPAEEAEEAEAVPVTPAAPVVPTDAT